MLSENNLKSALNIRQVTSVAKYQSFQYKLTHRAIMLNERLYYLKIRESQHCDLCGIDKETYQHFFFDCQNTQSILRELRAYVSLNCIDETKWTFEHIVMNEICQPKYHFANVLCLIFKQKLYASKFNKQKANAKIILNELNFIKKLERNNVRNKKQEKFFNKRWNETEEYWQKLKH